MPDFEKLGLSVGDLRAVDLIEGKNAKRKVQSRSYVLFHNGPVIHLLANARCLHMRPDITPG